MRVWKEEGTLKELAEKNSKISKLLDKAELNRIFDLNKHLKNIDYIFKRAGLE